MSDDDTAAAQRPISLIDATQPKDQGSTERSKGNSPSPSWRQLAKRPTKDSMREGIARWKYSKWQRDRFSIDQSPSGITGERQESGPSQRQQDQGEAVPENTEASDFAPRHKSRERGRKRLRRDDEDSKAKQIYEIDVLYENQRGWFFFGIPLYSHSSLLNFDPSPWVNRELKDSAVNITNAQVPDPSWEWDWNTWYVDMGYDVDEEGWQYSLSFARKFSWHGNHPWFHCFVRRRRWLRKRVKKPEKKALEDATGHNLTSDYFTIHPKRARSPAGGMDSTTQASSRMSQAGEEKDLPPEDIKDVPSLLKALKLATIDREKIDAVKKFVATGDEELVYLKDNIHDIMGLLVFQASRRQLLEHLTETAKESGSLNTGEKAPKGRHSYLRDAIEAAEGEDLGLEYWSDQQHILKMAKGKGHELSDTSTGTQPADQAPVDEIKGIAPEAELDVDPTKTVLSSAGDDRVAPAQTDGTADLPAIEEIPNEEKKDSDQQKVDDQKAKDELKREDSLD